MPSARVCSRPNGPVRLGPGRCCIRPMTRRSNQITSSVVDEQEDEDQQRLDQRQPPRGVGEVGGRVVGRAAAAAGPACAATATQAHAAPPLVIVTTALRRRRRRRGAHGASRGELVGQPDHVVGHRRSRATGSVIRPVADDTVSTSPSPTPTPAAVAADSRATRAGRRAGEERLAVLQPAGVEQVAPGGEDAPGRRRRWATSAAGTVGRRGAGAAATGPGPACSARTAATVRSPRNSPISAASRSSTRWSLIALVVERRLERPRTRPSQLTNVPAFSGVRRDRQHDVGDAR